MIPPPSPPNEEERITALLALDLLDTAPARSLIQYVEIAREMLQVPIAAISLIVERRQMFKVIVGLPGVTSTPRSVSFCAHAILTPEAVMNVPDSLLDERFRDNPLVLGQPGIRAYAGAPILNAQGLPLGAFCVIDTQPRSFLSDQLAQVRNFARLASRSLCLQASLRHLKV